MKAEQVGAMNAMLFSASNVMNQEREPAVCSEKEVRLAHCAPLILP